MKKISALLTTIFLSTLISATALGQDKTDTAGPDRTVILATLQKFFETMTAKDSKGAAEIMSDEGGFHSVRRAEGRNAVRYSLNRAYLERLPTEEVALNERMWDPQVFIRGDIATVWTPYDFWVDGKFSHCGIDSFTLVRIEGKWKITGGAYTVENDCEPSPLGPLKK